MCQAVTEQPFTGRESCADGGSCSSAGDPATASRSLDSSIETPTCDACPDCADVCQNYHSCPQCRTKLPNKKGVYSPCQIRRHNSIDSAWVVAGKRIYDVTSYVQCHPAGERTILSKAGGAADVTRDLEFHSPQTRKTMQSLQVGRMVPCGEENQGEWWKFW